MALALNPVGDQTLVYADQGSKGVFKIKHDFGKIHQMCWKPETDVREKLSPYCLQITKHVRNKTNTFVFGEVTLH